MSKSKRNHLFIVAFMYVPTTPHLQPPDCPLSPFLLATRMSYSTWAAQLRIFVEQFGLGLKGQEHDIRKGLKYVLIGIS
jgi:hypothetical protein